MVVATIEIFPPDFLPHFASFFAKFGAQNAINQDVDGGIHHQEKVADAHHNQRPGWKWLLSHTETKTRRRIEKPWLSLKRESARDEGPFSFIDSSADLT